MNLNKLQQFILEASRATYASGDKSIKKKQKDGSTTIEYKNGDYFYHDNYFGGEPYGGREVIFLNKKPVWMMVYYGSIHKNISTKIVYPFLVKSLSQSTLEMPYRGPSLYQERELRYENSFEGDIKNFSGTEKIYKSDVCIYEASYAGGLIDQ